MSTRGFVGFKTNSKNDRDGNIFGVYNHYDSYYSGKGIKLLEIYKKTDAKTFKNIFDSIKWTDNDEVDNMVDVVELFEGLYNDKEIYNDSDFLNDGLYCEYGYVYNLEEDSLELYRGFFTEPQSEELDKYGYRAYDGTVYHTHKVYTITRDCDLDKVEDMLKNMGYDENARDVVKGKYIEDLFMEK